MLSVNLHQSLSTTIRCESATVVRSADSIPDVPAGTRLEILHHGQTVFDGTISSVTDTGRGIKIIEALEESFSSSGDPLCATVGRALREIDCVMSVLSDYEKKQVESVLARKIANG